MTTIEIIQVIGVFGFLVLFLAYQIKDKKTLLLLQTLWIAPFTTQYFIINAISGAVFNAVCLIRTIFFYVAYGKVKKRET